MNESYRESVIFVKPRTNKESRDIIQRLHNIGKTEFYNRCNGEQIILNKDNKPFYSVILLADVVPLNKLFAKDYVFCIDKRKDHVNIRPTFVIPPSFKIRTYKEFMEMDTFELLGSFKETDLINKEVTKLIESGIDLPIDCCERFDLMKQEEKEMKENVKYTDVYKKDVKCLVRTDIIPWENCGIIGTIPYKEAINDLKGTILKVGDYVKVVDIRNEGSKIVTSIIVDIDNRLVPYCNKDYDGNKDILLIKVGEFPTYSHTVDPEKKEPRFITMDQSEFDKQALTYYKAQYKNTLSKLEVLQKKYDDSYRIQNSLENTIELLKRKIDKMESHMNTTNELSDKELIEALVERLFGVESAKNDIKDNIPIESIIPPNEIVVCRTKEECKWFIEEMEKIGNDNFYKFICAHDRISHITTEYLNDILEDPCVTSVIFYFSYDTNPFIAYYYKHDEIEVYEKGSIIEASDLMKQEEN